MEFPSWSVLTIMSWAVRGEEMTPSSREGKKTPTQEFDGYLTIDMGILHMHRVFLDFVRSFPSFPGRGPWYDILAPELVIFPS